jgi:L-fucose isomerase-like protein
MSIMDVFVQCGIRFTALKPHTAAPSGPAFASNIDYFDRLCRVVKACRNLRLGAIGARTTAFKTVRFDEIALQRHGVTTECYDLSELFSRVKKLTAADQKVRSKRDRLAAYTGWEGVPAEALDNLACTGVALDDMVAEYSLDCLALRCWMEMQHELRVSPCVLLSEMNDRGLAASCELDVGNALSMQAFLAASGSPVTCLDWNNNYGDEEDKCILFHCGPVPQSMMAEKGAVTEHAILANSLGSGCSHGCNTGRIKPMPMTYGSTLTRDGNILAFLGEGEFTGDPIPADYFGCAGVAEIPGMQDMIQTIGYAGFRHHVTVASGAILAPVAEAMEKYLGYGVMTF